MADNMECELCGGTDFYKEAGFFFCNECQTQSQEVREHEFQEELGDMRNISSKKIKQPPPDKSKNKITSWECYNVVLHALTKQLISLGADRNLKAVVKCLWMKYLEKLEVIHLDVDEVPKLQLVNFRKDAIILYGKEQKRKKRKNSSSDETSTTLNNKLKRSRKKRALAQADYESFTQSSMPESTSLNEQTLTSLRSESEAGEKTKSGLQFNRYGINELRKTLSKGHRKKHQLDKEQKLTCHKLTYRNMSRSYDKSVHYLSPIKLYSILYLGLLIVRDKIQLADLFRFIREGHLSFNHYTHLFPENYSENVLNIVNNKKNCMFSNHCFRTTAAKMASFLNVVRYIEVVDLTQLCQRYCKELNLPDEISTAVNNVISRTRPKLAYTKKSTIIPNYEGRAVSIILFTLKLLFGLDGATEFELSKYARLVNGLDIDKPKMFDIIKWVEYIGYRNLIVCGNYFPYSYKENSEEIDSDLFLQCIKSRDIQLDESKKLSKELTDYRSVLMRIQELQHDEYPRAEFPHSLTPFLDYAKIIASSKRGVSEVVLNSTFESNGMEFLLRPYKYLNLLGDNVKLKHGGANDNWVVEDVKSYTFTKQKFLHNHKHDLIAVEVLNNGCEKIIDEKLYQDIQPNKAYDPLYIQTQYQECRKHIFEENDAFLKKLSSKVDIKDNVADLTRSQSYRVHCNPYERYWLYLQICINRSNTEFLQCFEKYSHTFKLIFKECARVVEQTEFELLNEFQFSEVYLAFSATYCDESDKTSKDKFKKLLHKDVRRYVKKAEAYW